MNIVEAINIVASCGNFASIRWATSHNRSELLKFIYKHMLYLLIVKDKDTCNEMLKGVAATPDINLLFMHIKEITNWKKTYEVEENTWTHNSELTQTVACKKGATKIRMNCTWLLWLPEKSEESLLTVSAAVRGNKGEAFSGNDDSLKSDWKEKLNIFWELG